MYLLVIIFCSYLFILIFQLINIINGYSKNMKTSNNNVEVYLFNPI